VAQQGEAQEFSRDEAFDALAYVSICDDQFLRARTALESTLWDYGFALSPREMQDVKTFIEEYAHLSDEDFVQYIKQLLDERRRW
jgi:hypothetical protein